MVSFDEYSYNLLVPYGYKFKSIDGFMFETRTTEKQKDGRITKQRNIDAEDEARKKENKEEI